MHWTQRPAAGRVVPNAAHPNEATEAVDTDHDEATPINGGGTEQGAATVAKETATPKRKNASTRGLRRDSTFRSIGNLLLKTAHASSINVLRMSIIEMHQRTHHRWVLHPLSLRKTLWDLLSAAIVIFYSWMIPFMLCFDWYTPPHQMKIFLKVLDAWGFLDIALRFRTGIIECGTVTMDPKAIRHAYLHSFWFIIDITSTIPFEYFLTDPSDAGTRKTIKMIKYVKLPRLLRIGRLLKYVRKYRRYSGLAIAINSLLFLSHVAGCIWVALLGPCHGEDLLNEPRCQDGEEIKMYWVAFHHGIVSLLGISANHIESADQILSGAYHKLNGAVSSNIYMWGSIVSLVGALVTAALFGTIIDLVQSLNRAENAFRKKMDQISHEMDALVLPKHLRARVTAYYDYLWLNNRTFSEELNLLKDEGMSLNLRQQIAIYLFKDHLQKIPFFQLATDSVLGMICMQLHQVIYMPDDFIIREGDLGRELFMIVKGIVRVMPPTNAPINPEDKPILLGEGDFFGEIAVVMEVERTRSVKAQCVSELCILSREGFDKILAEFPEFAVAMKRLIIKRVSEMWKTDGKENIEKMTLLADIQMKKKVVQYNYGRKLRGTAQMIRTMVPRLSKLVKQPVTAEALGMDEEELAVVQKEAAAAPGAAVVLLQPPPSLTTMAEEEEWLEPIHETEQESETAGDCSPRHDPSPPKVSLAKLGAGIRNGKAPSTVRGTLRPSPEKEETREADESSVHSRLTTVEKQLAALEHKLDQHTLHVDSKISQILQAVEMLVSTSIAPPTHRGPSASLPPIHHAPSATHTLSHGPVTVAKSEETGIHDHHKHDQQ